RVPPGSVLQWERTWKIEAKTSDTIRSASTHEQDSMRALPVLGVAGGSRGQARRSRIRAATESGGSSYDCAVASGIELFLLDSGTLGLGGVEVPVPFFLIRHPEGDV